MRVRIPGWARNEPVPTDLYRFLDQNEEKPVLAVNGRPVRIELDKGYAVIRRTWKKGDAVELTLPMPVRRVIAHDSVAADSGRAAFQRGPVVYCAEAIDNDGRALDLAIADAVVFTPEFQPDLLNGVVVLKKKALAAPAVVGAPDRPEGHPDPVLRLGQPRPGGDAGLVPQKIIGRSPAGPPVSVLF